MLDRALVLTIDRAYFDLTGGLERWLYRIVRKHGGRQEGGWSFDVPHLYLKSGVLSPLRRFAFELRAIVARPARANVTVVPVTAVTAERSDASCTASAGHGAGSPRTKSRKWKRARRHAIAGAAFAVSPVTGFDGMSDDASAASNHA